MLREATARKNEPTIRNPPVLWSCTFTQFTFISLSESSSGFYWKFWTCI